MAHPIGTPNCDNSLSGNYWSQEIVSKWLKLKKFNFQFQHSRHCGGLELSLSVWCKVNLFRLIRFKLGVKRWQILLWFKKCTLWRYDSSSVWIGRHLVMVLPLVNVPVQRIVVIKRSPGLCFCCHKLLHMKISSVIVCRFPPPDPLPQKSQTGYFISSEKGLGTQIPRIFYSWSS